MKDKISIIEYLDILQKEWVQFFWASNVFPEQYRNKYKDLLEDRKLKIVDITRKIMTTNIFEDISEMEKVFNQIFQNNNTPKFIYRNDEAKAKVHHFNMVYFFVGQEVIVPVVDWQKEVASVTPDLSNLIMTDGTKADINIIRHKFNFEDFTKWL